MTNNRSDKFLWLLAGLGIGAGVALLFAPKSGRETRKYLKGMADESIDRVREGGHEVFEKGKGYYEKGKTVVDEALEFVDRGKKAVFK
ncbi:MAG: hypothetical protein A3F68_11700 [Acidobacteria bacterium RIFCSPLOWO2_12_FULL_54_10]|nr:MAG: hypothetical protein A3F68_11700 [Acidobacteria bacterium RIFCSPLOWO2_12_FULL_54_10]